MTTISLPACFKHVLDQLYLNNHTFLDTDAMQNDCWFIHKWIVRLIIFNSCIYLFFFFICLSIFHLFIFPWFIYFPFIYLFIFLSLFKGTTICILLLKIFIISNFINDYTTSLNVPYFPFFILPRYRLSVWLTSEYPWNRVVAKIFALVHIWRILWCMAYIGTLNLTHVCTQLYTRWLPREKGSTTSIKI